MRCLEEVLFIHVMNSASLGHMHASGTYNWMYKKGCYAESVKAFIMSSHYDSLNQALPSWLAEACKILSGGCLVQSGDRKFTVCSTVTCQMPNVGRWANHDHSTNSLS